MYVHCSIATLYASCLPHQRLLSRFLAHSGSSKPLKIFFPGVPKGLQAASWRRSHHQCRRVKESPGAASSSKVCNTNTCNLLGRLLASVVPSYPSRARPHLSSCSVALKGSVVGLYLTDSLSMILCIRRAKNGLEKISSLLCCITLCCGGLY